MVAAAFAAVRSTPAVMLAGVAYFPVQVVDLMKD
jgi:hypothetical protein